MGEVPSVQKQIFPFHSCTQQSSYWAETKFPLKVIHTILQNLKLFWEQSSRSFGWLLLIHYWAQCHFGSWQKKEKQTNKQNFLTFHWYHLASRVVCSWRGLRSCVTSFSHRNIKVPSDYFMYISTIAELLPTGQRFPLSFIQHCLKQSEQHGFTNSLPSPFIISHFSPSLLIKLL